MQAEEKLAIARLKSGEIDGLESLVKQYHVKAVRAAYLVIHDRSLAEDIVQDAFVNLPSKIHQFDSTRRFGPWFLRSVINASINVARKQKRLVPLDKPLVSNQNVVFDRLTAPNPGPEEMVDEAELRQIVWQALEQLTPNQRAAIVLRYYLEMSEAEMSATLASPRSSIKWWLFSARKRLRGLLSHLRVV
jgi:RNA polymerase sigma-70 factor (ECF subfamily)